MAEKIQLSVKSQLHTPDSTAAASFSEQIVAPPPCHPGKLPPDKDKQEQSHLELWSTHTSTPVSAYCFCSSTALGSITKSDILGYFEVNNLELEFIVEVHLALFGLAWRCSLTPLGPGPPSSQHEHILVRPSSGFCLWSCTDCNCQCPQHRLQNLGQLPLQMIQSIKKP